MQSVTVINYPCAVCGQPTSQWCSRCQSIWYCSAEHSKDDWAIHRYQCYPPSSGNATYTVNTIAAPAPIMPDLITVTAIYFDPAQEHTDLVNVQCLPSQKQSTYNICPVPLLTQYFPDGLPEAILLTQGLNGENLRFPLHLWYCPESHKRGAPANRSVHRITSNVARKPWCGPVVVLKFNGTRRLGYTDAGSNDLPALSAYFIAYE